jgi:hypothetical protein
MTTKTDTDTLQADVADETRSKAAQAKDAMADAVDRVPDVIDNARTTAERAAAQLPEAAGRARAGVEETTTRLQTYPDDTLRLLAVGSLGLAAGLYLAGAPRPFTIFAAAPAALAGLAMATRGK